MSEELRPCEQGHLPYVVATGGGFVTPPKHYFVVCQGCDYISERRDTRDDAIAAWNRRHSGGGE